MTTLESGFEDKLRAAILDDVEQQLREEYLPQAIAQSHERLRSFSDQYDVEPIIDSLQEPIVERRGDRVVATWGWEHPAAPFFEFGTSDHTIDGDPVLSFVWADPPDWVRDEFEREGDGWRVFFASVEVDGIEQTRFVRAGIQWLTEQLRA
mgnify:CR=1 FL=1